MENGDVVRKWSDESRISIRNCSDYSIEQLVSSQSGSMVVAQSYQVFSFFFLHDRDVERLKRHKLEKYFAADAGVARVSAIWSSNFALASDLIALSKYPLSVLRNSSRPNLFKQLDRFLDYQSQIAKFELKSIL